MKVDDPAVLAVEHAVAWADQPEDHPWLRERVTFDTRNAERPELPEGKRVVAWAVLRRRRRGEDRRRCRRFSYRKATHAASYGDRDWPIGAVDPRTIRPRVPSRSMGNPRERAA